MLRDLFEGTGVMSAMDHTKIEAANDPEALSVDAQAAKVAKRAADALRRSRAQVQVLPFLLLSAGFRLVYLENVASCQI